MLKCNTVGILTQGKYKGWYVYIQDAGDYYLILVSNKNTFGGKEKIEHEEEVIGYDNFAEDWEQVEYHFEYQNWEVEWLDEAMD